MQDWVFEWVKEWLPPMVFGLLARLTVHVGEVQAGRRELISVSLLYEVPIGLTMVAIGFAVAGFLGVEPRGKVEIGIVTACAVIGPRLVDIILLFIKKRLGVDDAKQAT